MMVIKKTLDYLRSQGFESEVLEFKEAKNGYDFKKLGKYFSALSNEANLMGKEDAWLVFGIKNSDKSIVGTNFRINPADLQSLKAEVADKTTSRITFKDIHVVNVDQGRVILFQIPPAPQGLPVAWEGHYYGRDGEQLHPLNIEELERMRRQGVEDDWSIGVCEGASIEDLSPEAIAKARELYAVKNPALVHEISTWDDVTFLNKAKICIQGKVTRAAILLLGKAESEHFINPGSAKITWILKDRDNIEKDYTHFSCPLLLEVENVYAKIRNLKYRYLQRGTLFPDEVDQFDPYIIREAMNNCIAHQDYKLGGKINVVEREDGVLTFINSGSFIPGSIEKVIKADAPETEYRNQFLANAMVNLNMIDTIGSGIKKMFVLQKNKFFPLPEYDFSNCKVKVQIIGKIIDENYARKLAQFDELSLEEIILLDKVAKHKLLLDSEIKVLRKKKLIEGRKPNLHISSNIATATDEKASYIKQKGFKDEHYKKMILAFIDQYGQTSKKEIDHLILDILPDILDEKQRENKVRNIIYSMSKRDGSIMNEGTSRYPKWVRSTSKGSAQ